MTRTIAAIATAPGNGGIGVVRISGPDADRVLQRVCRIVPHRMEPRALTRIRVHDPEDGRVIDDGLAARFPAPASYTGDDVVELQLHGGTVVLATCLDAVLRAGAVAATPGEFTERAFRSGRLPLDRAEAVAALIAARSESALRVARRQLDGALAAAIRDAGEPIRAALAAVEASIDYPEDVGEPDPDHLVGAFEEATRRIDRLLAGAERGLRLENGAHVVLVGRPNAGKSSLLNRLAGREHAIVTPIPGTTRDAVAVDIVLTGVAVRLVDTAGLRETTDPVEQIGVARARSEAADADIVVVVLDATAPAWPDGVDPADPRILRVRNKVDLADVPGGSSTSDEVPTSAKLPDGVDGLVGALSRRLAGDVEDDTVIVTKARHVVSLRAARTSATRARDAALAGVPIDCVAVDAHAALGSLAEILGGDGREETLREIFSRFCLGK